MGTSSLHQKDHICFELLKLEIASVMAESYPGINPSVAQWKGQEITDFQEDLRVRVNAQISEKWFYTHMKSNHTTLPRIDMLNFLSRYAGYSNWQDFVFRHQTQPVERSSGTNVNRYFYMVPITAALIVLLLFGLFTLFNTRNYTLTFVDRDTKEPITTSLTEVTLLVENESPVHSLVDKHGKFRIKTDKSTLKLVVRSPYYHTDTIERTVTKLKTHETVFLRPNDYALMLHYFSTMKVDDWQKRRERLMKMISDDAIIFQVLKGEKASGVVLFDKREFIDKLTVPSGSMRNIEILQSESKDGKIEVLRFRINDKVK